ncbi:MAG: hypothetical protein U0229_00390 [Anaeromyxobacter sp.]
MFHPEPTLTWVPATKDQIVAIIESINQPQVSIPGKPPQTVTGHLCALRNANGTFSIYVALHVPRTGENVVYVHDRRQVTLEEYRDVEIEGLQFLESMGFMLDNLNFRNLSAEVQEQTIRRIPLFGGRPPVRPVPAQPAKTAMGLPAAGQTGMMPAMNAAFPQISSTSLGIPAVAAPPLAPPAPAPAPPPAAPALGPRETSALARLLASF